MTDLIIVAGIIGITSMQIVALMHGIDGIILGTSLTIIGSVIGYQVRKRKK